MSACLPTKVKDTNKVPGCSPDYGCQPSFSCTVAHRSHHALRWQLRPHMSFRPLEAAQAMDINLSIQLFFFFNFRDYNIISFPSSFPPSKFLHISTHHTVAHPSPCLTSSLSLCSERVEPSLVHHTLAHQLLKAMCILLH